MALDNLDPSIPLAAGQIQIGDPKQLNAMLQMQLRMQQLRQVQQSQNALRQLYSPGNLDESGRPTANAMGQFMQVDPNAGMKLQNQFAQMDEHKLRTEALRGQVTEEHRKTGYEIGVDILNTFDTTREQTGDEKLAHQRAQDRRAELVDQACKDGSLPAACQKTFMPWDNDGPVKYRAAKSSYEAAHTKPPTAHERFEETGKFTQQTDAGRSPPVQYRQYADGRTTDLQGNPYTPTGVAEPKGAEAQLYQGKADGKDITVRMGPTGGWVNTETNEPVKGLTGIRKVGTAGEGSPQNQAFKAFLAQHPNASPEEMQHFLSQGFRPRSGQSAAVMKYMEEHPEATSDEIAKFVSGVGAQVAAARGFMAGKQGDTIRSFSVADSHLKVMEDAAANLNNTDMQTVNRVKNAVKTEFGYEGPVDFSFVRNVVGTEVSKAILGGIGGVTDREELRKDFDKANSPEQLAGVVKQARKLIGGQLEGFRRQYKVSTKGSDEDFNALLSDAARQDLPMPGAAPAGTRGGASAPLPDKQGAAAQSGAVKLSADKAAAKKQWDDAPPNTTFVLPDGRTATKP